MPKIKMLRNLGKDFYQDHGSSGIAKLPGDKMHEAGEVYDVTDEVFELLVRLGLGETPESMHAIPKAAAIHGVPAEDDDVSDVANLSVPEAADVISRYRSKDKLQHVIDTDDRHGVKSAAEKRLAEIKKNELNK